MNYVVKLEAVVYCISPEYQNLGKTARERIDDEFATMLHAELGQDKLDALSVPLLKNAADYTECCNQAIADAQAIIGDKTFELADGSTVWTDVPPNGHESLRKGKNAAGTTYWQYQYTYPPSGGFPYVGQVYLNVLMTLV